MSRPKPNPHLLRNLHARSKAPNPPTFPLSLKNSETRPPLTIEKGEQKDTPETKVGCCSFSFFNYYSEIHLGGRPWYSAATVRMSHDPTRGREATVGQENWDGAREGTVGAEGQGEEEDRALGNHSDR